MAGLIVVTVCGGVMSPPVTSQSSLADDTPGEGFRTTQFLSEALSVGNEGRSEKAFPCTCCFPGVGTSE